MESFAGIFAGYRKTSLVDYPGTLSGVVFFEGCNLRCPWCHNAELALGAASDLLPLDEILFSAAKRRDLVPGIVFTGGEPLARPDVPKIAAAFKGAGLLLKLDTNGTYPDRLDALFERPESSPDYVAVDIKTGPDMYAALSPSGTAGLFEKVARSVALLQARGVGFELRTLALPGFMDERVVEELAAVVPDAAPWYFGPFVPGSCLDPEWNAVEAPARPAIEALAARARRLGKNAMVRGLG